MIGQRGLRRITVDGHIYVWRVRLTRCPCCHSRAVVIADGSRRGSVVHLPGPVAFSDPLAITPALIASRIREARRLGWTPGTGRGVFARLDGPPHE
jgi:hypothetical protein